MEINKFAYFSKGGDEDASGDACMLPVDNLKQMKLGMDNDNMIGAYVYMHFTDVGNNHTTAASTVTLRHNSGLGKKCINQVCNLLASNPKDGFLSIVDITNQDFAGNHDNVIEDYLGIAF